MKKFLFLTLFFAFCSDASEEETISEELYNYNSQEDYNYNVNSILSPWPQEEFFNCTPILPTPTLIPQEINHHVRPRKIGRVIMYEEIKHLVKTDNNISKRPNPILIEEVKINKRKQLSEQVAEENREFLSRLNINNLTHDEIKEEERQDKIFYENLNEEYDKKILEVTKKRKYTK